MSNTSIIILIVGTIANLFFAWKFSIKAKHPHGVPRFFVFESILILLLLNVPVWLDEPFAWNQLISCVLLILSLVFAVLGFLLLHIVGKPQGDLENTSKLVTVRLYIYIRHPLYASLLLLGTGKFFKGMSITTALLSLINAAAITATAKREEKEMINKFSDEDVVYMQKARMSIPFVI